MPAPAFDSTTTSWPCAASSRTDVGVRPTRYSWVLTSRGTPTRKRVLQRGLLADLHLGDLIAVHLVRAVGEAQRASAGIGACKAEVVRHAAAAVHLHRPVDHLAGHVR